MFVDFLRQLRSNVCLKELMRPVQTFLPGGTIWPGVVPLVTSSNHVCRCIGILGEEVVCLSLTSLSIRIRDNHREDVVHIIHAVAGLDLLNLGSNIVAVVKLRLVIDSQSQRGEVCGFQLFCSGHDQCQTVLLVQILAVAFLVERRDLFKQSLLRITKWDFNPIQRQSRCFTCAFNARDSRSRLYRRSY